MNHKDTPYAVLTVALYVLLWPITVPLTAYMAYKAFTYRDKWDEQNSL